MPKIYRSEAGDKCDSDFEVLVVDNLIERGIPYEFHPDLLEYTRPTVRGRCTECGSHKVRRLCYYEPDLYLPSTGIYVELKGGSITGPSRGRLTDFIRTGPDIELRFLFRDNRTIKGLKKKVRHTEWAKKLGCEAAVGLQIPEAWL